MANMLIIIAIPNLPIPALLAGFGLVGCCIGAVVCVVRLRQGKP